MKFGRAFASACVLALTAVSAWSFEPVSRCQELERWAAQLEKLPATYEELIALEPDQRQAVYRRLSAEEQALLWQEQLDRALARKGLDEEQKTLVEEVRAFATPANFEASKAGSGSRYEAVQVGVGNLDARIRQIFSREDRKQLFYFLGPLGISVPREGLIPLCNCRPDYTEFCSPFVSCTAGGCGENPQCGPIWMNRCYNYCFGD